MANPFQMTTFIRNDEIVAGDYVIICGGDNPFHRIYNYEEPCVITRRTLHNIWFRRLTCIQNVEGTKKYQRVFDDEVKEERLNKNSYLKSKLGIFNTITLKNIFEMVGEDRKLKFSYALDFNIPVPDLNIQAFEEPPGIVYEEPNNNNLHPPNA